MKKLLKADRFQVHLILRSCIGPHRKFGELEKQSSFTRLIYGCHIVIQRSLEILGIASVRHGLLLDASIFPKQN